MLFFSPPNVNVFLSTLPGGYQLNTDCTWPAAQSPSGQNLSQNFTFDQLDDPQTINFYVWQPPTNPAWWQTIGGSVHSDGNIVSNIPDAVSCIPPACYPNLMREEDPNSPYGVLSYGEGDSCTISTSGHDCKAYIGDVGSETYDRVADSDYAGTDIYDYNWWINGPLKNENIEPRGAASFNLGGSIGTGDHIYSLNSINPTSIFGAVGQGSQGRIVVLRGGGGDGDLTIADNQGLTVNESTDSFLLVIARDKITIGHNVDLIEGIFIADDIVFASDPADDDTQLDAQGTFIGWNDIDIQRDIGDDNSPYGPSVIFTYRPDLMLNAPAFVKKALYTWQQQPG